MSVLPFLPADDVLQGGVPALRGKIQQPRARKEARARQRVRPRALLARLSGPTPFFLLLRRLLSRRGARRVSMIQTSPLAGGPFRRPRAFQLPRPIALSGPGFGPRFLRSKRSRRSIARSARSPRNCTHGDIFGKRPSI